MRSLLFVTVLVSSAACATTGNYEGAKQYAAPTLALPRLQADLAAAVTVMVRNEGWELVAADDTRIEALTPVDASLGVAMRERWVFTVSDYEVAVVRTLEAQFDKGGVWAHESVVCTGYVYLREHEVLGAIEQQVERGTSYAVAGRVKQGG